MSEAARDRVAAGVELQPVEGERGMPSVNGTLSAQARLQGLLVGAIAVVVGVGILGWYLTHSWHEAGRRQEAERRAREGRTAGDTRPPPLVRPPLLVAPAALPIAGAAVVPTPAAAEVPAVAPAAAALTAPAPAPVMGPASVVAPPPVASADRRLTAPVTWTPTAGHAMAGIGAATAAAPAASVALAAPMTATAAPSAPAGLPLRAEPTRGFALDAALRPTVTAAVRAQRLPDRRLLLPKGAMLDCTLETAIDSTLPGLATCVLAVDVFGADGSVVLIERGTRLVGETRADVRSGQRRLAVLWNEARTPTGVSVALASPATDALGRTGLAGDVDHHFWDRFGAALLVSVVDGVVQAAARSRGGGGTAIVLPGASAGVVTEVLRGTMNVPPTVSVPHGERVQVLVARDVDFSPVYRLRTAP